MRTDYETLSLERIDEHVLLVYMDRPAVLNAMNTQMGLEWKAVFEEFYVDTHGVRCIVVTGRGDRAFCAGGDLKERNNMSDAQWRRQHQIFEQGVRAVRLCPIPVIAAVNGVAFGGGCERALNMDFVYASTTARFALPEVRLGIMPGAMGTQNLPRAVGERRAKELILTGTPFTADEAYAWGMVNKVCAPEDLLEQTLLTAMKIAENAPIATMQAKKSVTMAGQIDSHNGYIFELEAYQRMVGTEDRLEGVRAFNEKRPPRFQGR